IPSGFWSKWTHQTPSPNVGSHSGSLHKVATNHWTCNMTWRIYPRLVGLVNASGEVRINLTGQTIAYAVVFPVKKWRDNSSWTFFLALLTAASCTKSVSRL